MQGPRAAAVAVTVAEAEAMDRTLLSLISKTIGSPRGERVSTHSTFRLG